jgi:cellulose synthase/poly-beta-1,6-N-acetylglucosamine synthase-like glycosyltransferase
LAILQKSVSNGFLCGMYHAFLIIAIVLTILYSLLILLYRRWFLELPAFQSDPEIEPLTSFSVIIPARNESENVIRFLASILDQQYPKELFEVIVINDHSTDDTSFQVKQMQATYPNLFLLELSEHLDNSITNAYKKKAIEIGIAQCKGDWVVTTDADCLANPEWLLQYNAYILQEQPVFVAAPVMFFNTGSFISLFQVLDFMSLQGITAAAVSAGSHSMCNGANLAYQKAAFYEVDQFKGIDHLASGDDMFLMQKIKKHFPGKLGYLFNQNAIIQTLAMPDWKSFFNQRIRWASKASSYQDKSIFWVLLLVYLFNLSLLILALFAFFVEDVWYQLLLLLALKTFVELSFMIPVARFYGLINTIAWFPIMEPFHIIYTVTAGWLGKFGSYQWKGRKLQ